MVDLSHDLSTLDLLPSFWSLALVEPEINCCVLLPRAYPPQTQDPASACFCDAAHACGHICHDQNLPSPHASDSGFNGQNWCVCVCVCVVCRPWIQRSDPPISCGPTLCTNSRLPSSFRHPHICTDGGHCRSLPGSHPPHFCLSLCSQTESLS